MKGVGDQVHHDLMHLRGVCGHHAAVRIDVTGDFDISGDGRPDQIDGFFQNGLHADGQFLRIGLPAERQYLFDQVAAAPGGSMDLLDAFPYRLAWGEIVHHHLRQAGDGKQDVVQIVGDAAGQRSDGLHFLGLLELGFQSDPILFSLFALGNVRKERMRTGESTVGIDDGRCGHPRPDFPAVFAAETSFIFAPLSFFAGCHLGLVIHHIFFEHKRFNGLAEHFFG